MLALQIDSRLHERHGGALNNFAVSLPPPSSDMAAQAFKDPYLFDFLGTAPMRREAEHSKRYSKMPGDVLMNEGGDLDKLGRGAVCSTVDGLHASDLNGNASDSKTAPDEHAL